MANDTVKRTLEVYNLVEKYMEKATHSFRQNFKYPVVDFDLKGRAAGQAVAKGNREYKIRINKPIMDANWGAEFEDTVAHEVAHIIEHQLYGKMTHKDSWKRIMKYTFGIEPKRCHSYQIPVEARRKVKRHFFQCSCMKHEVPTQTANKIMNDVHGRFTCKHCKEPLNAGSYVGWVQK